MSENPVYRKFTVTRFDQEQDYYVPVGLLNPADEVLCDTHNPNSNGFGGRVFQLETIDGEVHEVKGPWHTSAPYDAVNITELHLTKVTIIAHSRHIQYKDWDKYPDPATPEFQYKVTGEVLYHEKEWVLGSYNRGDRIAYQLANLQNRELFLGVQSQGGGHSMVISPDDKPHYGVERQENKVETNLSPAQDRAVFS